MQDRPTGRELLDAVAQFLQTELVPATSDPRLKFRALVAANVVQIVARELAARDAPLRAEWSRLQTLLDEPTPPADLDAGIEQLTRALCAEIRAGGADDDPRRAAVLAHARQTVIEKLQVSNPCYLERFP